MFLTSNEYYETNEYFKTIYECVLELNDQKLTKELLNISSTMNGQKVIEYASIVYNIAIKQNRWDLVQDLYSAGLV